METETKKEDALTKGNDSLPKLELQEEIPKQQNDIKERSEDDIKIIKAVQISQKDDILQILKIIAPGTALRSAITDIVKAEKGALIVQFVPSIEKIIEGGFRVNCMFTPQRLVELSKMDGAIIMSEDMKRILYANTLLAPSIEITTRETGTRHKAAERTAKQFKTLAIAVSERRKTVTVYYNDVKYVMRNTDEILRRAIDSLQLLEKQCEIFNDLLLNLNVLEFTNLTNLNDVCLVIQRAETIIKISSIIKRYITELGVEGSLIKMRLRELVKDVEKEELLVINDYTRLKVKRTKNLLSILSFEELLEPQNVVLALGFTHENSVMPKGYRILNKANLGGGEISRIIKEFNSLNFLLESPTEALITILKSEKKARKLQKDLISMKEQVMLGKKI